jgi:hypothetical protein
MREALRIRHLRAFGAIFAAAVVARFAAFQPGYSNDDFAFLQMPVTWEAFWAILGPNGRPGAALLLFVLAQLGGAQPHAFIPVAIVATTLMAHCGYLVAHRLLEIEDELPVALVGTLFAVYPYFAEVFSFRVTAGLYAFALWLAVVAVACAPPTGRGLLVSVPLLVAALTVNQAAVSVSFSLLLLGAALQFTRERRAWKRLLTGFAAIALALGIYAGTAKLIALAARTPLASRTQLVPLHEIPLLVRRIAGLAVRVYAGPEPVIPPAAKAIPLALWAILAGLTIRRSVRDAAGLAAVAAAMALSVAGFATVVREHWMVPRVLAQSVCLLLAPFCVLLTAPGLRLRRIAAACAVVLAFSYALSSSRVLQDQTRLNEKDRALAVRIIAQVEAQPEFGNARRLAIVNSRSAYADNNIVLWGDLNTSALYVPFASALIVRELAGWAISPAYGAADAEAAKRYCRERPPWPAAESAGIVNDLAVVCLTR